MTENGPRGCVIHSLGLFCGIETGIGVCVVAFKLLAGPETDIEGGNCCKLCHSRCNCYYIGVAFKLITNITTEDHLPEDCPAAEEPVDGPQGPDCQHPHSG